MNLKSSMLKIGIVIALIIMLVPVIAAEDVDESISESVDQSDEVISEDVGTDELATDSEIPVSEDAQDDGAVGDDSSDDETDGTDEEAGDETDEFDDGEVVDFKEGSADLQIVVVGNSNKLKVGDIVKFGIIVFNNGPDTATNVIVRDAFIGDIFYLSSSSTKGYYDPYSGVWYVGDLEPGEYAILTIEGIVLSDQNILYMASVTSDTPDPDESNNFGLWLIEVESGEEAHEPETLPATGNPIALALLALLTVAGVSLRRRF